MKKVYIFFLFLIFLIFPSQIKAQNNFLVDANIEYKVEDNGLTYVTNIITIKNINNKVYAKSFYLNLAGINPQNLAAFEGGVPKSIFQEKVDSKIRVRVDFDNELNEVKSSRTFIILYQEPSFAVKTGETWEITIPKLEDFSFFDDYSVTLSVPKSFGNEAYISPYPSKVKDLENRKIYAFEKNQLQTKPIILGFGESQVFSFKLNYHLENPSNKKTLTEIAIPPATSIQEIYYKNIDPLPLNIITDDDGNWLAQYELKPRDKIDVKVEGWAQIFASHRPFAPPSMSTLLENTKSSFFWQTQDPQIKDLSQKLQNPREIYDYVTKTLSYNFDKVSENNIRLGAKEALANPKNAICLEFTDLFITLTRSAGIPAREINGYAYSTNPKLQPLSLVTDVLHAWPEYWDEQKKHWISVDPTWGSTSQVDFFDKFDLRHITFVIHGKNPTKPYSPGSYKLGNNPQKDVFVNLDKLPEERFPKLKISYSYDFRFLLNKEINVVIENSGPSAFYEISPQVIIEEEILNSDYLQIFPPFAKHTIKANIPIGILGSKIPDKILIKVADEEVEVVLEKSRIIINQLLILFAGILLMLLYVGAKTKKLSIFKNLKVVFSKDENLIKKVKIFKSKN